MHTHLNPTAAPGRIRRYEECRCRSLPLQGEDCAYCGLLRGGMLDGTLLVKEARRVKQYRSDRIRGVTDCCVETHLISWAASAKAFRENGKSNVKLAGGRDCCETTVLSDEQFAQRTEEEISPPIISRIHFRDGKTVVPFSVPSQPVRCDDFRRIGVRQKAVNFILSMKCTPCQAQL